MGGHIFKSPNFLNQVDSLGSGSYTLLGPDRPDRGFSEQYFFGHLQYFYRRSNPSLVFIVFFRQSYE